MRCPNCEDEIPQGSLFCPSCDSEVAAAPSPANAARDDHDEAYEQELAAYQAQRAAREQQRQARRRPQKTSSRALALVVAAVLLLGVVGTGAVLAIRAFAPGSTKTEDAPESSAPAATLQAQAAAFGTAEEALLDRLAQDGIADWVYEVYEEGEGSVVYITGPPSSEWVSKYTVAQGAGGEWSVTGVTSLAAEGTGEGTAGDAEKVVWDFLVAVSEDRGKDAQALTADPFRSDAASAQVSEGGLTNFAVTGCVGEGDGTFWVQTTQTWYDSPESWEYWVVPTDGVLRIADVQAY